MKQKKTINLFEDTPVVLKVSPNKKVNPNSTISKEFLEYYAKRYELLFGVPAKIEWGKDANLINKLLKTYEDISIFGCESKLEFLVKACEKYFISRDNLALKSAWSIGVFYCSFSKIVLLLKHGEESNISPIIEGFKLAYMNDTGIKYNGIITEQDKETFAQIYLFLKPIRLEGYSLKRFAELFFLVMFDCLGNKKYDLGFFISKFAQNKFENWINTEGKEILMFYPKGVSNIDKEKLMFEEKRMMEEERELFYGIN